MKINLLIIVLLIGFSNFSECQNLINDTTSLKLRNAIADFKTKYQSPSIVVAIVHDKEIIFTEALGYVDLEKKTPATIDSKYPIASVTKTFTATMFMQLVERGVVKLDDDVKKYVPEYKVKSDFAGSTKTTLLQLATHTAGLPRNSQADVNFAYSIDRWLLTGGKDSMQWFPPQKELLKSLQFVKIEYPPYHFLSAGDRHYSNLGYCILGIALERAGKVNLAQLIKERICKPLKMGSTGFLTEEKVRDEIATGYWFNTIINSPVKTPYFEPHSALPAGGMYSTARDLSKYLSFQFQNDSSGSRPILSMDGLNMMRFFKIAWKPSYPFVMHEGSMLGSRCIVAFNPDLKIGWVILTNTTELNFSRLNEKLQEIVSPLYSKKPIKDFNKYVGIYKLTGGYGSLEIYLKNDSLYSTYQQDILPGKPMIPDGDNRFKVEGKGNYSVGYEFLSNDNSEITALHLGQLLWNKEK